MIGIYFFYIHYFLIVDFRSLSFASFWNLSRVFGSEKQAIGILASGSYDASYAMGAIESARMDYGLSTVDGDGTVPLLSLGYMCKGAWREFQEMNPGVGNTAFVPYVLMEFVSQTSLSNYWTFMVKNIQCLAKSLNIQTVVRCGHICKWYSWWKKSCTSWHVVNIPILAGFYTSQVVVWDFWTINSSMTVWPFFWLERFPAHAPTTVISAYHAGGIKPVVREYIDMSSSVLSDTRGGPKSATGRKITWPTSGLSLFVGS